MGVADFFTTKLDAALGWARKYSIFQYPFVTACCGMEYMATACSHYDVDRFGAGLPRFSPRQADVLFVVGTISHKMAPVLRRVYDQMTEPKWVVAFGVCTCTGGFYDNYATVQGIDTILPVDVIVRAGGGHVLHAAARRHERVLEDGELARPADRLVELGGEEGPYSHSSPRFCQI